MPAINRLVFAHTAEGLFVRAYGKHLGPELTERLRAMGLDVAKLPASIDAKLFGDAFRLLRDTLHPGDASDGPDRAMGQRFLDSYFETVMGSLVRLALRMVPTDKALLRASTHLKSGTNYIDAAVEQRGPKLVQLTLSDYSTSPGFMAGIMHRMAEVTGGKQVRVTYGTDGAPKVRYLIEWQ